MPFLGEMRRGEFLLELLTESELHPPRSRVPETPDGENEGAAPKQQEEGGGNEKHRHLR